MIKQHCVFTINPGSTSTKVAFVGADGKILWQTNVLHEGDGKLSMRELLPVRSAQISKLVDEAAAGFAVQTVVGRGGPMRPVTAGTYRVNERMIEEMLAMQWSDHPSNLGAPLAREFAARWNVAAYVVDPVSIDNFVDVARISGIPQIQRRSRAHALNIRSCAHLAAAELGKPVEQTRFVVAHLGGGISIAAVDGGRIIDVNDALLGMGPFSPERAGALPIEGVIDLAFSGNYTVAELKKYLSKSAGLSAYLGTNSMIEVEKRIEQGDAQAELIFRAMIYQIAKEIGAYAVALQGRFDALLLTGGLANSKRVIAAVAEYTGWLGRMLVYPGEREMEAMAAGAYRVLNGSEAAQDY